MLCTYCRLYNESMLFVRLYSHNYHMTENVPYFQHFSAVILLIFIFLLNIFPLCIFSFSSKNAGKTTGFSPHNTSCKLFVYFCDIITRVKGISGHLLINGILVWVGHKKRYLTISLVLISNQWCFLYG